MTPYGARLPPHVFATPSARWSSCLSRLSGVVSTFRTVTAVAVEGSAMFTSGLWRCGQGRHWCRCVFAKRGFVLVWSSLELGGCAVTWHVLFASFIFELCSSNRPRSRGDCVTRRTREWISKGVERFAFVAQVNCGVVESLRAFRTSRPTMSADTPAVRDWRALVGMCSGVRLKVGRVRCSPHH